MLDLGKPKKDQEMNENEIERQKKLQRTIYVGNLNPLTKQENIYEFFSVCGKVNLVKIAGNTNNIIQGIRYAFVEFSEIESASQAYKMQGHYLLDKPVKIGPAKNTIISPVNTNNNVNNITNNEVKINNAMTKVRMLADQINNRYKGKDKDKDKDKKDSNKDKDKDKPKVCVYIVYLCYSIYLYIHVLS